MSKRLGMPSFCASAVAADATLAVLPLLPVAPVAPELEELALDAPEEVPAVCVLPDELLPAAATLELPLLLALSVELPPQALKARQAATAAAPSSKG